MNHIGERIQFARKAKGLTQEQLAANASLPVRTLQRIESGRPSKPASQLAIAKALNMPISKLVTGFTEEQLEQLRDENLCPHCSAPLYTRVPIQDEHGSHDMDIFACGYDSGGRMCPSQIEFPTLEAYELGFHTDEDRWWCNALGKSDFARLVPVPEGFGYSRDEAEADLRANFARISRPYSIDT